LTGKSAGSSRFQHGHTRCCFGGLSLEETAEVLDVSTKTVMRDWEFAKTWLRREVIGASGYSD
jgi:DNA-directed RNA polymerase specialized sigma24 family protein